MGAFEDYTAALNEFSDVQSDLDNIAHMLDNVSKALIRKRAHFSFSNTDIGLPYSAVSAGATTIDAGKWVSALEVMSKLKEWHDARQKVQDAWRNVPSDQKRALRPPPAAAM